MTRHLACSLVAATACVVGACVPPGASPDPLASRAAGGPGTAAPATGPGRASADPARSPAAPGSLVGRVLTAGAAVIANDSARIVADHGGGFMSDAGGAVVGQNVAGVVGQNGAGVVGQNGAGVVGQNGAGVVGQNGAGVVGPNGAGGLGQYGAGVVGPHGAGGLGQYGAGAPVGWPASYRLQALAAGPVGAARVQRVDAAGAPVGAAVVTGADGRFALPAPAAGGPFAIVATFTTGGKAFTWRAADAADAAPAADAADGLVVDEASTLAMERGRAEGLAAGPAAIARFAAALRPALAPASLPYMADDSPDRLAAVDQLLLDVPGLRATAAALASGLARPRASWTVETVVSPDLLQAAGMTDRLATGPGPRAFLPGEGREAAIVTVGSAAGIGLVALGRGLKARQVAQLPREAIAPIRLVRGAGGRIHVAARLRDSDDVMVWDVAADGTVTRRPAPLAFIGDRADLDLGQLAADEAGRVYMADTRAHVVRRLEPGAAAAATVVAGRPGEAGRADGPAADARFRAPEGVAIGPGGALYVADTGNHTLRRVGADGGVTTLAGQADEPAYRNGRGAGARLGAPEALAFGPAGDIYLLDRDARRVRRLSRAGSVFVVAGSGEVGNTDGPGPEASFRQPSQLALGPDGSLYLRDAVPAAAGGERELVIRRLRPPAR